MANYKRKTKEEKIAELEARIVHHEKRIEALRIEIRDVHNTLRREEVADLYEILKASGLSFDEIKQFINKAKTEKSKEK